MAVVMKQQQVQGVELHGVHTGQSSNIISNNILLPKEEEEEEASRDGLVPAAPGVGELFQETRVHRTRGEGEAWTSSWRAGRRSFPPSCLTCLSHILSETSREPETQTSL
mmetsp:Transcript_9291/g.17318  ORF Transcript_9291/g.17318 Transcript_9291/m.17318 type:complete len:110 (+) Transcript_9291:1400-1729(+)